MFLKISEKFPILCLLAASVSSTINVRKPGWLYRVVQYRKEKFIEDVQKLPAVQIHARVEPAPPGFEDSKKWDFDSVIRLLGLLRQSQTGREVHRALRRSMMQQPNRRIYMSFMDTFKYFPRIHHENYYDDSDMESLELLFDSTPHSKILDDNDVIIVSNPVEARLPSTKISVKMLRTILEERAFAARIMPPTTRPHIDWKPMNKTKRPDTEGPSTGNDTKEEEGGNSTSSGSESGGTTGSGGSTTTGAGGSTTTTEAGGSTTTAEAGGSTTTSDDPAGSTTTSDDPQALRNVLKNKSGKGSKPVQRGKKDPPQNKRKSFKLGAVRPLRKAAPKSKKLPRRGR